MITKFYQLSLATALGLLLCISGVAQTPVSRSKPRVILNAMVGRYAKLTTYQDTGVLKVVAKDSTRPTESFFLPSKDYKSVRFTQSPSTGTNQGTTTVSFRTYFRRPRMLRVEWQNASLKTSRWSAIWSDGAQAFSWLPYPFVGDDIFLFRRVRDLNSLYDDPLQQSGGVAFIVPSLLIQNLGHYNFIDALQDLSDLSLLKDEPVEGEQCYTIRGKISGVPWTFWIGKHSYLLRKIRTLYSEGGSFHEQIETGVKEAPIAEELHSNIRLDGSIPKALFKNKPMLRPNDLDASHQSPRRKSE